MAGEAALVIDVGTGGAKCISFDFQGHVLAKKTAPIRFRFDGPATDFDPAETWRSICGLVREVMKWSQRKGRDVVAVSSTSMREGNVFYDKSGQEVLAVPNIDGRATKEGREIASRVGELVYQKSGHWPNAAFMASRLRHFAKHETQRYASIRKASMINDWVLFKLTGILRSEPTNGCETTLFDIRKRRWSDEIGIELGIDIELLPDISECGTSLGSVSQIASRETTLPKEVEVVVGAADTEAALLGSRVIENGAVAAVAGTTTPVQSVMGNPIIDPQGRTWTCCHVIPGKWVVESNAGATGMVFDWWARTTRMSFAELDRGASSLPPGSNGVRVTMGSNVFNARIFPPIRGRIDNVMPWTEPFAVARAIVEGACYAVRANLEQLESVLGIRLGRVAFCGGSATSNMWTRIQADVLDRTLDRFGVGDTTARGAAMLAVAAINGVKVDQVCSRMATDSVEVIPSAKKARAYAPLYGAWLDEAIRPA